MATTISQHRAPSARAVPLVAGSFGVMLCGANLAGPLYAGYAQAFGFSSFTLTVVFAAYAVVLMFSLLVFGQISDRYGRRLMILVGLGVASLALILFAMATGVGWLVAARACQGVAQGMMSGAATAALAEVYRGGDRRRPALLATLAQSGGSAVGVMVSGALAQWTPWPTVTPYVLGVIACLVLMTGLFLTPIDPPAHGDASGARGRSRGSWIQRPRVPREIRPDFTRIATTAAAVWAVAGGLFLGVMPSYAATVLATDNLAILGAVSAVMLVSSCGAQLLVDDRIPAGRAQGVGLLLLTAGLGGLVVAAPAHAPALLALGAAIAGCGHGIAVLAAQDELNRVAPAEQRGAISAAFYVCIYLGVAVPVVGIGVVSTLTGSLFVGVCSFALFTGAVATAVAVWHLRQDPFERNCA